MGYLAPVEHQGKLCIANNKSANAKLTDQWLRCLWDAICSGKERYDKSS